MIGLSSYGKQPWTIRDQLARQLDRGLRDDESCSHSWDGSQVPPALAADVLAALEIGSPQGESRVRSLIDGCGIEGCESFDELVERKVLRVSGGEVHWFQGLRHAVKTREGPTIEALRPLLSLPLHMTIRVTCEARRYLESCASPEVHALASAADPEDGLRRFANGAIAPGWVSARLWERRPLDASSGVWWWYERNLLLRNASTAPDRHWSPSHASSLMASILDEIKRERDLAGWDEERRRVIAAGSQDGGLTRSEEISAWAPVPDDFFGKLEWISELSAHNQREHTGSRESMLALVGIFLRALEHAPEREAPHSQMRTLLELARERPAVVTGISWSLSQHPAALADMLYDRDFAAWALDRIAGWQARPTVYASDAERRQAEQRIISCFESAVRVALDTWLEDPSGAAEAFTWFVKRLHEREEWRDNEGRARTRRLRLELWKAVEDHALVSDGAAGTLLDAATGCAASRACIEGFAGPWFKAGVALVREGGVRLGTARRAETQGLLSRAYLAFLDAEDREEASIGPSLAAVFVAEWLRASISGSPFREPAEFRETIFGARDDRRRLHQIRSKLRTHIRLFARAIQGWGGTSVPETLVDSLCGILALGTANRPEDGLVDAFAASEEVRAKPGPTLAEDVACALSRLSIEQRTGIVQILTRLDEPMAMATISDRLRGPLRALLRGAVGVATAQAPVLHSISDVWARIDTLLNAELYDQAEAMLRDEASLRTLGEVGDRSRWRFVASLRLDLGKERFDRILETRAPADLARAGDDDPQFVLDFYQALAELIRPDGCLDAAEQGFARLSERFPNVRAYAENLHATRIRRLIGDDESFPVGAEKHNLVASLFAEGEASIRRFESKDRGSNVVYAGNRAILLMALGQFERVVTDLGSDEVLLWTSDKLVGLFIRALSKLGRSGEAAALLGRATDEFGVTKELADARLEMHGGSGPLRPGENRRCLGPADIREALGELLLCSAEEQAAVAKKPSVSQLTTDIIAQGCARVSELIPTIQLKLGKDDVPWEEAINLLLTRLLEPIVQPLGWSVHAEDPGGFTTGSKWGSRDLAIKKNNSLLAVFEAQRVRDGCSFETDIAAHIRQLLRKTSYSDLGVHLLWSFAKDPAKVLDSTKRVVEQLQEGSGTLGFQKLGIDPVITGPLGFASVLRGSSTVPFRVIHLVIDMKQGAQRTGEV